MKQLYILLKGQFADADLLVKEIRELGHEVCTHPEANKKINTIIFSDALAFNVFSEQNFDGYLVIINGKKVILYKNTDHAYLLSTSDTDSSPSIDVIIDGVTKLAREDFSTTIEFIFEPTLPNEDFEQQRHPWNDTKAAYPLNKTIHELFEEQVLKTPERVALIYEHTSLTYNELNQKANRIARYLKNTFDLHCDDLVALYLDRSEHIVIAILAVLKTGAAYVPMDPSHPDDRIVFMLKDTKAKALVCNTTYESKLGALVHSRQDLSSLTHVPTPLFSIDSHEALSKIAHYETSNLNLTTSSNQLVYIIYTSGTTGVPKGVMIEHRNLVCYVYSITSQLLITENNRSLIVSDYIFDLGLTGLYPLLLCGGTVHIANKDNYLDPSYLLHYLQDQQINFLKCTPLYFESVLLNHLENHFFDFKNLKLVLGGERCSQALRSYLLNNCTIEVIIHYGPCETTIGRARSNSKCNILYICENVEWTKNTSTSHLVIGR